MTIPLQMYAAATGTTDGAATIFTPVRARISAIYIMLHPIVTIAQDYSASLEVSFQSTSQRDVNDASGILASGTMAFAYDTDGNSMIQNETVITNIDILWEQGQRVYMHLYSSVSVQVVTKCILYTNR